MQKKQLSYLLPVVGLLAGPLFFAHAQDVSTDATKVTTESAKTEKQEEGAKSKTPHSARWPVSWGVDPDIAKLGKPVDTSIAHLCTFKRPAVLPLKSRAPITYKAHRYAPIETTLWRIKGVVVSQAAEHDGDYRLIVADSKGNKVCCVMPDPELAPKTSKLSPKINAARAVVLKRFHPTYDAKDVYVPVEIIAPGYFGRYSPDENPSPEGFQLHPVISVRFLDK